MKKAFLKFKRNWKTTLSGMLVFIAIGLYFFNHITTEQFSTATAVLVSVGFFASKDSKPTDAP